MRRDIVVFGASAGGISALQQVIGGLPPNLPAAMLVVVHTPPWHKSELPQVLSRNGWLASVHPADGQVIEPGKTYVAPPDHHIFVDNSHIQLWRGPKENHH